jgi:hypothetical protein
MQPGGYRGEIHYFHLANNGGLIIGQGVRVRKSGETWKLDGELFVPRGEEKRSYTTRDTEMLLSKTWCAPIGYQQV